MAPGNTAQSYGSVARLFHWLMALMILTAIPLGFYARSLPHDSGAALAQKAAVFSLHKTLGVAILSVAALRILWALAQPRPAPVHPGRRLETWAAEAVHWTLYLALVAVPLAGWVEHAATEGFAPILWPLGQNLPLVPESEAVAQAAAAAHRLFVWILIAAVALHVLGALKHALVDRDGVLARMTRGAPAPAVPRPRRAATPALAALAVWAAGLAVALTLAPPAETPQASRTAAEGDWQVTEGSLTFTVAQMGARVQGDIAGWSAEIAFDGTAGQVEVTIDMASLILTSVTPQLRGAEFLDTAAHPTARFSGPIRRQGEGWVVDGRLTLKGVSAPLALPFSLAIEGDTARAEGAARLERLTWGIGPNYPDAATVGLEVEVAVRLTAVRR